MVVSSLSLREAYTQGTKYLIWMEMSLSHRRLTLGTFKGLFPLCLRQRLWFGLLSGRNQSRLIWLGHHVL